MPREFFQYVILLIDRRDVTVDCLVFTAKQSTVTHK